jgi:phage gp45-like
MHRTTPIDAAFRGYTSGGARSVVEKVDDAQLMQEVKAHFMNRECREHIESPQNYGFTSYTTDSDK